MDNSLENRIELLASEVGLLHDRLNEAFDEAEEEEKRSHEQFLAGHALHARSIALSQAMALCGSDKITAVEVASYARTFAKILAGEEPKGELVAIKE